MAERMPMTIVRTPIVMLTLLSDERPRVKERPRVRMRLLLTGGALVSEAGAAEKWLGW
jgi:hypothetical protein